MGPHFAERLRKFRREKNMTQETLAQAVGISHQSVSKWERSDGLPDITLLPKIAGCLGVTIDALLGYDEAAREKDITDCICRMQSEDTEDEARLALGMEYRKKYPGNDRILHALSWTIMDMENTAVRDEYLPVLRECCETILDTSREQAFRDYAVKIMCRICPDHELEKWYGMCACSYEAYAGEVMENRLKDRKDFCGYRMQFDTNNLRILMHLLGRMDETTSKTTDRGIAQMKFKIRIMEALTENGEIPDAWLGEYAHCHICLACRCFSDGKKEEGYRHTDIALDAAEKWWKIPDGIFMNTGKQDIFGGCEVLRNEWILRRGDGMPEDASYGFCCFLGGRESMYSILTSPNWPGFHAVREEERFMEYVTRAKAIADAET